MPKEIENLIREYTNETKRHFDVVAEDIQGSIKAVAEQVGANTEKLMAHDQRFDTMEETIEKIKMDIKFIKNGLKQKVDQEEFAVLERRVSLLESKLKAV